MAAFFKNFIVALKATENNPTKAILQNSSWPQQRRVVHRWKGLEISRNIDSFWISFCILIQRGPSPLLGRGGPPSWDEAKALKHTLLDNNIRRWLNIYCQYSMALRRLRAPIKNETVHSIATWGCFLRTLLWRWKLLKTSPQKPF